VPFGIGDQEIALPAHVCVFHDGELERRRVQLRILGRAIDDTRQGMILLAAPGVAETMLEHLETDLDRSLASEVRTGRLLVAHYDRDPDQLLENVRDTIAALATAGYAPIRCVAQVSWGAPGFPLPEDHLWAESRVNDILSGTETLCVCVYDTSELPDLALLHGGLETHPQVAVGDLVTESPSYLAPPAYMRAFLEEISPRG
jgi:hypothetical protein